jgi:predicted RNA-binding protein with RPS1 domain
MPQQPGEGASVSVKVLQSDLVRELMLTIRETKSRRSRSARRRRQQLIAIDRHHRSES